MTTRDIRRHWACAAFVLAGIPLGVKTRGGGEGSDLMGGISELCRPNRSITGPTS